MASHRPRPPALFEETIHDSVVSSSWKCDSISGSMRHKASGMHISPSSGIQCDGREYRLSAADVELDEDGLLGSGASGSVWRGVIKTTGTPIALKTLCVDKSEDRMMLLNEVRALIESEGCAHLVQWYAGFASQQRGCVHLVLELMDRGSLADLQTRLLGGGEVEAPQCGLPPRLLACIASQALQGLAHLHDRKLLHNDIKPGNVLLNGAGEVKISDFGITRSLDDSVCRTCIGTHTYLAPEKFDASGPGKGYSFPSDIWSFGVVLYELAAGVHPFASASTFPEILQRVLGEDQRLSESDGHSKELCDFVERCLTRDADKRADATQLLGHKFLESAASPHELGEWLNSPA